MKYTSGPVEVVCTEPGEKMMALMRVGKKLIISFSRMGFTNFRKVVVPLDPAQPGGVDIKCPEMIFMLHKCLFQTGVSTNCEDIQFEILTAAQPRFAKSAARNLNNFNNTVWDGGVSEVAMFSTTLASLTSLEAWNDFKAMAAMIGDADEVLVVEANDGDDIWAINMFTQDLIKDLLPLVAGATDPEAEFFSMAKSLFKGQNKLGEMLTPILGAVRNMEHAEYMKMVEGVVFFEAV
jgi:predicted NAD-dependent protein-ADP-ribosyltransferase YbiA (DUF1768 family)